MRFTFDGFDYALEFQREQHVPAGSAYGKVRTYTTARVLRKTGEKSYEIVREWSVGHNPSDRFSFESGRKAALSRALYDAPIEKSKGTGVPLMGTALTKEFRTAVWQSYHARFLTSRIS